MSVYLQAVLIALAVGAGGTALGACGALVLRSPAKRLSSALLGLAGGIVLALVVLDMIPEAWEMGGAGPFIAGFAAGIVVLAYILVKTHGDHAHDADPEQIARHGLLRTGLLLAAGMAVHNLPQGIALGAGLEADYIVGLAVLLFLHNIPEGMAMAIPLRIGHISTGKIFAVAVLTAVPTVAGALLGAAVSEISAAFIGASMAFAAGAMLYLTLRELIPQATSLGGFIHALIFLAAGFGVGSFVIWLLD